MRERKERKSKGSLSVLDEFTSDSGAGEIVYAPKANPEVLKKIEKATRLADVPISSRSTSELTSDFGSYIDDNFSQTGTLAKEIKSLEIIAPAISTSTENQRQSRDKVETEPRTQVGTNQRQSEDKVETSGGKTRDVSPISRDKVETEPRTQVGTNQRQSEDKVETFAGFSSLVGLQRLLIIFLYNSCKASRSYETEKLSIEHIAKSCETSVSSAKKTLQRLEQKKCFKRVKFKDGRGGWTIYELENGIFQDLLRSETEDKLGTKWRQTEDKVGTQLETQPRTSTPYSSSNLNINTTTIELPENLRRFGISTVNLEKLVSSGKTTQEVIERSLAALSFDVGNGKTGNLANILFGVLGTGREYISQKYSETLQTELDQELARIQQAEENQKRTTEIQLQAKFKAYIQENPTFLELVRNRNRAFVKNDAVLEKVAFEEFKGMSDSI